MMNSTPQTDELIESFGQQTQCIDTEHSVNIPTWFRHKNQVQRGWINLTNPFAGTLIMGPPGSGKTETFIRNYVQQLLKKGFSMAIYDYKSPDLSRVAYASYLDNQNKTTNRLDDSLSFHAINFSDPRCSARCNPFLAEHFTNISDARQAAKTILCNLNITWVKHADAEQIVIAGVNYLAACILYLKRYDDRKPDVASAATSDSKMPDDELGAPVNYCTLPHLIEFATRPYYEVLPLLASDPDLASLVIDIKNYANDSREQLEGMLMSMSMNLSCLKNPILYWIMTGQQALVDINNPADPKILCLGNDPAVGHIFSTPLALITQVMMNEINRRNKRESALIVDELPTLYLSGLENLLATSRSNKLAICLSIQDLTQLELTYGNAVATCLFALSKTIISSWVLGASTRLIANRINKSLKAGKPAWPWSMFSSGVANESAKLTLATIEGLPAYHFVGEVSNELGNQSPTTCFLGLVPSDNELHSDNTAELPVNSELADLSGNQITRHLGEHMASIQQEITDLIQQESQRLKLR